MGRQHVDEPAQNRGGVPHQRDRRSMHARGLRRVGVDPDHREVVVGSPMLERMEHPRADADDHVGLAPQFAAERERDAQGIAAVEHAAAAPIGQHRRLQHRGQGRHLGGCVLSAPAANDHRALGAAEQFRRRPHRVLVDRRVARRERRLRRAGTGPAPHVDRAFQHRGPAPPREHRRDGLRHQGGGLRRRVDAGGKIDQTRNDAGLIADFMQVTDPAPDVGMGNLPDQPEHRRVHRISGQAAPRRC